MVTGATRNRKWAGCGGLLAGVLLLLVSSAAPALGSGAIRQDQDPELALRLRQAERRLEQGDTVGALLDVEAVLARDDEFAGAYLVRGRIQTRMGDDLGARDSFTRAAELDPGNGRLHFLVASLAVQLADFESAARQLSAAAQAEYDPAAVDQLARTVREYLPVQLDLEAVRAAPRVAVVGDSQRAPAMSRLVRELRTLLLDAPEVALVPGRERAQWVARIIAAADADVDAEPRLRFELVDLATGEPVLERELPAGELEARVALGDVAEAVVDATRR